MPGKVGPDAVRNYFRIKECSKSYESVDEMQKDLDAYLEHYNNKRPHQGRNMNGRTPYKAFVAGLPKPEKPEKKKVEKKQKVA